ncbi:MAG: transposase [Bacteroidales bacterium]|nr:transposase [Bacteroidales bacterium]
MKNWRKTPRADWLDYDNGLYFITICTDEKHHFFGKIHHGTMNLSKIGLLVDHELFNPHLHHKHINVLLHVVMPNHLHAIVECTNSDPRLPYIPTHQRTPNPAYRANPEDCRHATTLSKYISSFKSAITRQARKIDPKFGWQERYHDHLIRGNNDLNTNTDYINNNPTNWDKDCFNEQ